MDPVPASEHLAARQHGLISRTQALALGLTRRAIDTRVASDRWRPIHRGVYLAIPLEPSWHQRLMAAVLVGGPSAVASHRSAAALWKLDGIRSAPIEISVKTGLRIPGAIVHRRRADDDPDIVSIDRVPATTIERTLLDLAAVVRPRVAGLAMDDSLRRGDTDLRRLGAVVPPLGRAGRAAFRLLLEERDERDAVAESPLETMMLRILRRAGLPPPVPQYEVHDAHGVVARIDFAYPEHRLGLETDGYRWHSGVERWRQDLRRENRLKLLGWTLLRFSWADLSDRPDQVIGQVRAALSATGSPHRLPSR